MSYPTEFASGIRELYTKLSFASDLTEKELGGPSKAVADQLKLLAQGPSPRLILMLLEEKNYDELKLLAEAGLRAAELREQLRQNWRKWCPHDPPGNFRASAFMPEGELVDF